MSRLSKLLFCLTATAMVAVPSHLSAATNPNAREGKWETTTTMEMTGLPVKMPPVTTETCVTKEDLADPDKSLPKASKDGSCKVSDYKVEGTKVTWTVKCTGQHAATGSGEMTYKGDSYEGTLTLEMADTESPVHGMTLHFKGHRLGDCTK